MWFRNNNDPNNNVFGLIEEIYKLKPKVTGKLLSISIKTYRDKNVGKN